MADAGGESTNRFPPDQLMAILNAVTEAITVQDAEGLVWANDAAAELMGIESADALLAMSGNELVARFEIMDSDRRQFAIHQLPGRRALQGEEPPEQLLGWRVKSNGILRWSLVRARPVRVDGVVRYAVNVMRDITERVMAAEAMAQVVAAREVEAALLSSALLASALPRLSAWSWRPVINPR